MEENYEAGSGRSYERSAVTKAMRSRSFVESTVCPYFRDGRVSRTEFLAPEGGAFNLYRSLLALGYRRLGNLFYRTLCPACSACVPLRIPASAFVPSRSQKRTLRMNGDVRVTLQSSAPITAEKLSLYRNYIESRHQDREKAAADPEGTLEVIHYGYSGTIEMDYRLGGRLIGVGIVDEAEDALSSNYFYYDTEFLQRRPGVFSLLSEIAFALTLGKRYLYLGFVIEDAPRMSYKKFFRPNEIFRDGRWKAYLGA